MAAERRLLRQIDREPGKRPARQSPDRPMRQQPSMRWRCRQQWRELRRVCRGLVRRREEIIGLGAIEYQERQAPKGKPVWVSAIDAIGPRRVWIKQAEPATPAAPAQLVVAAHHDPRRDGEKRR